jgi:cytochrome b involved in lipid metabolism
MVKVDKSAEGFRSRASSQRILADSRVVTAAEVAQHASATDCWVIIHGKVYDVTDYVPKHPGGAMIYVRAGGDCTQLFDSYHTKPYVRYVAPTPACIVVRELQVLFEVFSLALHRPLGSDALVDLLAALRHGILAPWWPVG